jgi:hypothetical protein
VPEGVLVISAEFWEISLEKEALPPLVKDNQGAIVVVPAL